MGEVGRHREPATGNAGEQSHISHGALLTPALQQPASAPAAANIYSPAPLLYLAAAAWVEKHREAISACLRQHTGLTSIVWRPAADMLREEGCAAPAGAAGEDGAATEGGDVAAGDEQQEGDVADTASSGSSSSGSIGGEAVPDTIVTENNIKFSASPLGQKTGYYADQRDSRAVIRQLAGGRRVLDLCCYSGGFALFAAAGGAEAALGVDSSAAAVELAARNAVLNGLEGVASFVKADVTAFMKEVRRWWVGWVGWAVLGGCGAPVSCRAAPESKSAAYPPHCRPWRHGRNGTWWSSTRPSWRPAGRRWRRRRASTAGSTGWPCRWASGSGWVVHLEVLVLGRQL